jgi:hypothetical protein
VKRYGRPSGAAKRPRPEGPSPPEFRLQDLLRRAFPAVAAKLTTKLYGQPRQTLRKRSRSVLQSVPVAPDPCDLVRVITPTGTTTARLVSWRKIR